LLKNAASIITRVIAILASCVALLLTFVAVPRYEPIFLAALACSVLSGLAAIYLAKTERHRGWMPMLVPLILFTSSDVDLRYFAHTRLLDLL